MLKRFRGLSILLISIGLILISCAPSTETLFSLGLDYELGLDVEQDYKTAVTYYSQAANQGDAPSQYRLGYMYQYEKGFEQDYETARYWYEKSANQDNLDAQYKIGSVYHIEQDYEKARYWYEQVASEDVYTGYAHSAKYQIGSTYYTEKDYRTARYWYEQAANQGNVNAQYALGNMYRDGIGVEQDYETARYWYEQTSLQNNNIQDNTLALKALEDLPEKNTSTLQGNIGQVNDGTSALDSITCGNGDFDNLRTILPAYNNIPALKETLDSVFLGDFQSMYSTGKAQGLQTSDLLQQGRDAKEQLEQNRDSSIQALNQFLTVDPVAWIAAIDAGTADTFILGDESQGPLGQDAVWSRSYLIAQYGLARINMIIACYEEVE